MIAEAHNKGILMMGQSEFHEILGLIKHSELYSKKQFQSLCNETSREIQTMSHNRYLYNVMFFNRYYNLDWDHLKLLRLGRFLKNAGHVKEFELYAEV